MKKLFLFFAMAIIVAACGQSVEEQAEAKFDQIIKTFEEGDAVKAGELFYDLADWTQGLSVEDQQKVTIVSEKYALKIAELLADMQYPEESTASEYVEVETEKSNDSQVTEKAKEYCNKIVKALKKGDLEKAENLMDDLDEWQDGLNDDEWDIVEDVWASYEDQIDELYYEIEEY